MLNRLNGKISLVLILAVLLLLIIWFKNHLERDAISRKIAQKIMLDIRYYCADTTELVTFKDEKKCISPVTQLPDDLKKLISDTSIGSIILFAENFTNIKQTLRLTDDLQQAALASKTAKPLLISVDQEGGRVVRLPRAIATSFSGNMAIGATYENHGSHYATVVGEVIGAELSALGVNVNHSPDVDVNINPNNPVINVRSFGENADVVAQLGTAQLAAMQEQGLISTLKHFPGHGDTSVDSHTGLPKVEHDIQQIENVDLKPFKYAIDHEMPGMIMTAHIQYPQLDNTEFIAKDGKSVIFPATMSRRILTDLLRKKMGFKGLIVTDALNMAGIAHYYNQTEAVIQTFAAGTDIALMPIKIRRPADIVRLKTLISDVAAAVQTGRLDRAEMNESAQRIAELKATYQLPSQQTKSLEQAVEEAQLVLDSKAHKMVEQQLANNAIVTIKNNGVVPIANEVEDVLLVMPDRSKCMGLTFALKTRLPRLNITCDSLAHLNNTFNFAGVEKAELVLVADITPDQSLAELGGMDDIKFNRERSSKQQQIGLQETVLKEAKSLGKQTLFISLRTPYNSQLFMEYSDGILASFSYRLNKTEYIDDYGRLITQYNGPIFNAIADVLTGKIVTQGNLPVSIESM